MPHIAISRTLRKNSWVWGYVEMQKGKGVLKKIRASKNYGTISWSIIYI